ncbi:MAG: hypothetical protein AAFZ74_09010 [Pseudomonadota bacterium]
MREPDDPGPDWWPTFSKSQFVKWWCEGFALPFAITALVFVLGFIFGFVTSTSERVENGLENAKLLVMLGFWVSGGSASLFILLDGGLNWKTSIRVFGLVMGVIAYWTYLILILLL